MDFHTEQRDWTGFVYVLPFTKHTALVEYTVFSPKILEAEEYSASLDTYLREQLGCQDYSILEREYGVIRYRWRLYKRINWLHFSVYPKTY
jgi:lycopene beta-cyclase